MEIQKYGKINWKRPIKMSIISAGTCFLFGFMRGHLWVFSPRIGFVKIPHTPISSSVWAVVDGVGGGH